MYFVNMCTCEHVIVCVSTCEHLRVESRDMFSTALDAGRRQGLNWSFGPRASAGQKTALKSQQKLFDTLPGEI